MTPDGPSIAQTCFFEQDASLPLVRRATAEGVGTMLLMLIVIGAGLAERRMLHGEPLLGLALSAVATSGGLVGLIFAFGAVSGGHFNPVISGLQWLSGERKFDCTLAYIAAQIAGAIGGAFVAKVLFGSNDLPAAASVSGALIVSEIVATAGLMIVVFGCARGGKLDSGPLAVGAWLVAAIIATPSTSYANPAVTIGALFANGPVAISSATALRYVPAELAGGLLAYLVISICYRHPRASDRSAAPTRLTTSGAAS
jgi:glycerol uptake facilitator-like aquaporin